MVVCTGIYGVWVYTEWESEERVFFLLTSMFQEITMLTSNGPKASLSNFPSHGLTGRRFSVVLVWRVAVSIRITISVHEDMEVLLFLGILHDLLK